MTEESAKEKRARDVFEQMIKGKNLVESECRFFKTFVDEKLEEQRIKREELGRMIEKNNRDENVSVSSNDISSDLGEENPVSEQLQNLRVSERDNVSEQLQNLRVSERDNEVPFEILQNDVGSGASSSHSDSHYEETESISSQRRYPNEPLVDYCSFVSMENRFLTLTQEELPFADDLRNELIKYPLNVQFDEFRQEWYICDQKASKIIKIKTDDGEGGVEVLEHKSVPKPSAICILKEGRSIAILCENFGYSIIEYNSTDDSTEEFCSHKSAMYDMRGNLRGLAKSIGKNLMSLDAGGRDKNYVRSLRIFKKEVGAARFPIEGAINPCFIASNGTNVAISDLGSNNVYLYRVDDRDWSNIRFQRLKVIESKQTNAAQLCNCSGFAYVAGLQFDVSGNLLIGDARGRTIKLYDQDLTFLHRLSSDFPMPYMSSFWVNSVGKMLILDIKSPTQKLIFAQLGNTDKVKPWNAAHFPAPSNGTNRQFRRQ